jgi:hypothetical protein
MGATRNQRKAKASTNRLLHHAVGRTCTSKGLLIRPTGSCRLHHRGCR